MRAFYILLVAATAFLASSEALSLSTDSDQAQMSQLTSLGENHVQAQRFLRTDDDEERAWANIFSIKRTKEEAIDVMGDWLAKIVPINKVAEHLKVSSYNKKNENFNALVEYVRMTHKKWTGEDMTRKAAKAYLKEMFN